MTVSPSASLNETAMAISWPVCEKTVAGGEARGASVDSPQKETMSPDPQPGRRVLVVEDEPAIRELLALHLKLEGFGVVPSADGAEALRLARAERFDLIVLDVMLPGLDGISVCAAVRRDSANRETPILMLTARREESDKVLGLETGADDYLTKPFGVREFVARVRALQRRHARAEQQATHAVPVAAGPLTVDPTRRQARLDGREIDLTANEFDLLYLLVSNRGIVFSREALMQRVWGAETHITERSVDTLVKRVRRKIEDEGSDPRFILTVWGTGYKFADV
jgi:two-component system OmpR family response regulator/two-component system alkaline phosphatase synthesis response regulator PhoP